MRKCKGLTQALRKAIKSISAAARIGSTEQANAVCAQTAAKLYYYNRKWAELKRDIPRLEALDGKDGMPYIFKALWEVFKQRGFGCDEGLIADGLEGYNCNSYELDMLGAIINAAAMVETGLVCDAAISGTAVSVNRLQAAFNAMKRAEITDFTYIYPQISATERRLSRAEPHYEDMTAATKSAYRGALRRYAKRRGCTEEQALAAAVSEAKRAQLCLGEVLGVDTRISPVRYLGLAAVVLALSLTAVYMLCPLWALLVLAVPLGAFALGVADFCFSIRALALPCPAISPEKLPKAPLTLTVITTLLEWESNCFEALERFYLTNREDGLFFGILADLPSADEATTADDAALIADVCSRIQGLNARYGNRFCLFVRRRTKAAGGKWNGRERKRGAIEDLIRYLTRNADVFCVAEGADLKGVRFLLTLDADTNLPPGGAAGLTGMLLHPINRPFIKDGRVMRGYGILQPAVQTALESSRATRFSALISGVGGIDVYESAAFNRQQSVFGEGVFCGKGIIDIGAYAAVLDGVLPDGRVLSHDMPEGNILRTRYVSDLRFTDNVPSQPLAYYGRLHRWIRGDTQNLSLLAGYKQGALGGWRIVQNLLRHLCPMLSFAALAVAGLTAPEGGLWVCLFALLGVLSPFAFTLISRPKALRFRARRFFSSVKSGLIQSASTVLYELCALCHKALITADAVFRALWRLVSGKGLLSWVTAAQAEKADEGKVLTYVYRMFPSAAVGAVFFFATRLWVTRLLGLTWFLFPVYCNYLSLPTTTGRTISATAKRQIKSRALPIWRFFEDQVNESTAFLPPDNIQMSPVSAVAMRTSPTNIGLYLLCVTAAEDFGFITHGEAVQRISDAISTMERLEKWRGHLYNWYALDSLQVLGGRYVSTVDSGNLCVCLVALSRWLYGTGDNELAKRAEALFTAADFTALYNKKRSLFALGYDGGADRVSEICYDLYMSEARSTSYFALAFGQAPLKHWRSLGRPIVGSGGHIGMASWSGTAFEYFMPHLLLPIYKNSFASESLHFALNRQRSFAHGRLWGCSESAYFCFDADMNYQYKAHGVQSLALTRYSGKEKVLSPYSVYLSMCIAPMGALRTLSAYDKVLGGRYGLYEAIDCETDTPIQSYMAHHMGMSLIACANACFDGVFVKRFMSHPRTAAFYELLQEQIPVNACVTDANKESPAAGALLPHRGFTERLTDYNSAEPFFHISGNGANTITADSAGHIRLAVEDISVNEAHFVQGNTARSLGVLFCDNDGGVYAAAPYAPHTGKFSFESAGGYCAHICSSPRFSGRVKIYTDAAGCFVVETKSKADKDYSLIFSFDVQLAADKQFYAHPAFNRLFVSAAFDKESNALVYTKNSREGKGRLFMAVGLAGKRQRFEFETNKDGYPAFSLYTPFDVVKPTYSCTTGVCVTPFCLIKTPPVHGGEARLIIAVGHSREECIARLNASRRSAVPVGKAIFGERENHLLKGILYGRSDTAKAALATEGALWGRGISGDYPIIAVLVRELYKSDILFYLKTFKRLAEFNRRIELVFLVCEEDSYSAPATNAIKRLIALERLSGFTGARGGIFFADGTDSDTVRLFKDVSVCFCESYDTPFAQQPRQAQAVDMPDVIRRPLGKAVIPPTKGCYHVDKAVPPLVPYSYVLAGRGLGAVVTHGSLGYSFYGNAALRRIASFEGDMYGGTDNGECLLLRKDGQAFDLIACSAEVLFGGGVAVYKGDIHGNAYTVTVFVCEKLPLKIIRLRLEQGAESTELAVIPLMGSGAFPAETVLPVPLKPKNGVAAGFAATKSSFFGDYVGFIACFGDGCCTTNPHSPKAVSVGCSSTDAVFVIGAAKTATAAELVLNRFARNGADAEEAGARAFAAAMLPPIQLLGASSSLAEMLCCFAPYQAAACRFFARGAFYQSSGAYGFRDQLQDCLYLVYSMPHTVRTHILRAAARQYTDGGVQHWWHACAKEGKTYGIRSTCSDDFLWLPICTAEYVRITGDLGILDVRLPYLYSPPLGKEKERYEAAGRAEGWESLYKHCVRALRHGQNYGKHGLPLMGCCDWNDAFSDLGDGAESVFSGFLYVIALKQFGEIALKVGDGDTARLCATEAEALIKRCSLAFDTDRFVRAYGADGRALGVSGRAACEIDALCQAFAVFAGADAEKCRLAMKTAFGLLYDKENKLLKLFAPPFGSDTEYAGYINAYAKGVRENGGQYTHAAVWFAAALAMCGLRAEATELITAINPLWRAEHPELFARYKTEPYAIAADIYTARGQAGRGGWTFYTGAAAWYCKVMLECFLGVQFSENYTRLNLCPVMEYEARLEFWGKLHICARKGATLTVDGKPAAMPLLLDGKDHYITVPLA